MKRLLRDKELFMFDLDGVFYKGKESRVKIGGTAAVEAIRSRGKSMFVLTNNSTDTAKTVWNRLVEFGIRVDEGEVITSGLLTAEYLRERYGSVAYYLVGERGLEEEMEARGHKRTRGEKCDVVVVGLDRRVTYDKLDHAARLVRGGAKLVATHAARVYAYRSGPAMATGPLVRAIEYASGRRATIVGKPSTLMFEAALKRAGCEKAKAVMVGDQLDTDIDGALAAGIDPILVTSGVDGDAKGRRVLATLANVDDIVPML